MGHISVSSTDNSDLFTSPMDNVKCPISTITKTVLGLISKKVEIG